MKKLTALIMTVLVLCTGCGAKNVQKEEIKQTINKVRLGGLKGPTAMGLVKLLDDAEQGKTENKYEFTMSASADELTPKILNGELDILAVPSNLGAVLYNNSNGAVRTIAVNTLGIIYIAEKGGNTVHSITDLKGKTIYASGKNSTPEYALEYLLEQNGLDAENDVEIQWKSEPTEVISQMAAADNAVVMLPQPFISIAANQFDDLRVAVDLTKEWDKLGNGSRFITAALIARTDFIKENPYAIDKFLSEYADSADYVNKNIKDAAKLTEKYDIVKSPIAEKAIPYCNIVCITGEEMKTSLSGYFKILFGQNPASLGGKLPNDDFYCCYEK